MMSAEGPPTFSSPDAKRAFERQEAAREEVHPLDWQDDFGPLKYTELTKLVMHMQRIERARDDAAEEHALAIACGYQSASHFRRVRATFLKYWGAPGSDNLLREFSWKEPEFSQALMGAMQLERDEASQSAQAKNPALLAPEEGLSLENYAALCAQMAGRNVDVAELTRLLTPLSLDVPTWERVNKSWLARMSADTTGTVTMAFTKAYTAAGAGQFGAAAQAASQAMGGPPGTAPLGSEPIALERYAEIGVAMASWTKLGKDVDATLRETFQIHTGDLATIGMYWQQRFAADVTLLGRYGALQESFKAKYDVPDPDADLVYESGSRASAPAAGDVTSAAPGAAPLHPRYERWSAFLAKIRKRIDDICAETEGGTRVLIAQDPTNPQALKTAQQALNQRVENIRTKIEAAFTAENLYHDEPTQGAPPVPAPEAAYEEWHATERYLNETWTTCKVHCMSEFLRAMKPYVEEALAKPIPCVKCGAHLTPSVRHSSETVTCAECQTVNQCIPEPLVYAWFSDAPHNLALEQVLPLRYAVLRAGEDVAQGREAVFRQTGEHPPEPLESKQKREAMAREYYVAFAAAKAKIKPTPVEEQAAEVQRSMVAFRQSLEG